MTPQYEFKREENDLIASLAGKMSFVGLVSVVLGILYLISAVTALVFLFQDRLPPDVMSRIPEDVRTRVPNHQFLWGIFIQMTVTALIFLMIGIWTRSAAASFYDIVATSGRDITHLMNALAALLKMYTLVYTIIMITLIATLVGIALQLFLH